MSRRGLVKDRTKREGYANLLYTLLRKRKQNMSTKQHKNAIPVKVKLTVDSYADGHLEKPSASYHTTAFVYPQKQHPFVVEGPEFAVRRWIEEKNKSKELIAFVHLITKIKVKIVTEHEVVQRTYCTIGLRDDIFVSVRTGWQKPKTIHILNIDPAKNGPSFSTPLLIPVKKIPRKFPRQLSLFIDKDAKAIRDMKKMKKASPESLESKEDQAQPTEPTRKSQEERDEALNDFGDVWDSIEELM